jgi:hypothetical protein
MGAQQAIMQQPACLEDVDFEPPQCWQHACVGAPQLSLPPAARMGQ